MKAFVIGVLVLTSGAAMAADGSCRSTAGAQKSAELVRQCKAISEATHPPCNASNPCDMMVEEITRWCGIRRETQIAAPAFCGQYR
jgi:5-methylcytosine-specific restriction endonuclease McrA